MTTSHVKYYLSLLMFGSNGIVASYILLNSYETVLTRTLIGSLFLTAVFLLSKKKPQCLNNKKHLAYLIASGAAIGISWMFLYEAYSLIGVSLGTIAYYCGPGIVILLSPLIFKEKLTWARITGFLCILLGLILANLESLTGIGLSAGLICGLLSAVAYSAMVIFNKKATSITGLENSTIQLASSFVVVAIFTLSNGGLDIAAVGRSIIPILILGVVNTGIGCYMYFSSIQDLSAGTIAVGGYIEPLSALILSGLFLGEALSTIQIMGAVLILGGSLIGELLHNRIKHNT